MNKCWDAIVIGAGPAGASCAVWLKQLGLEPLLLEAADAPGGLLRSNSYQDIWTVTNPGMTGQQMAPLLAKQIKISGLSLLCNARVTDVASVPAGYEVSCVIKEGQESRPQKFLARHVVVASGVRARKPEGMDPQVNYHGVLVGPGEHIMHHDFHGLKVAILGGGDNAFENYLFVKSKGAASARIFARTVRAQRQFVMQVPAADIVRGGAEVDFVQRTVNGEGFDRILVFYGWQPCAEYLNSLPVARDERGFIRVNPQTAETNLKGLYAIGEVTQRMHPCVPTAMADGVIAAKAIESRLRNAI